MIREIVEVSGAKVDINDDGVIKIASADKACIDKAKKMIMEIAAEPELNAIYDGRTTIDEVVRETITEE